MISSEKHAYPPGFARTVSTAQPGIAFVQRPDAMCTVHAFVNRSRGAHANKERLMRPDKTRQTENWRPCLFGMRGNSLLFAITRIICGRARAAESESSQTTMLRGSRN